MGKKKEQPPDAYFSSCPRNFYPRCDRRHYMCCACMYVLGRGMESMRKGRGTYTENAANFLRFNEMPARIVQMA